MLLKLIQSPNFLEDIFSYKQEEVELLQQHYDLKDLQNRVKKTSPCHNFQQALQQSERQPSLIAEVKKASPSRGVIRSDFDPVAIAQAYQRAGATCLSVLTDTRFFRGSFENLHRIRQAVDLPLLCKEFIIDPIQVYLARLAGADAVLLIASMLSEEKLGELLCLIQELGMEALVEVHNLAELDLVLSLPSLRLIGINNRNLATFTVNLTTTQTLLASRRDILQDRGITTISESGLGDRSQLDRVVSWGVDAVLVGEALMKQADIESAVQCLMTGHC
ncbi:indole-3-glycerol phosphate synthase TrpC [Chamaesiphon minutus]|uniref:Indole-3-glycerol phosphate synthase n=1 Tax=Chamaesiphon minutus (strain ATCC 27169 / PCC 6605) TaxID=1173020 RepID=K9UEL7_CHAP6|nr:indole-3-glycerol phosphate synthase TrpC [Chamaesiphon minutus]AFY92649.1 Indole-3-glycerol phosphate synthase [Chamaesiphon minutus PCC 6605]